MFDDILGKKDPTTSNSDQNPCKEVDVPKYEMICQKCLQKKEINGQWLLTDNGDWLCDTCAQEYVKNLYEKSKKDIKKHMGIP